MDDVIRLLPDEFRQEREALEALERAGMLSRVDVQFEYPGDDDAPDGTT